MMARRPLTIRTMGAGLFGMVLGFGLAIAIGYFGYWVPYNRLVVKELEYKLTADLARLEQYAGLCRLVLIVTDQPDELHSGDFQQLRQNVKARLDATESSISHLREVLDRWEQ